MQRKELEMSGGTVGSVGARLQLSGLAGNLQMQAEGYGFGSDLKR